MALKKASKLKTTIKKNLYLINIVSIKKLINIFENDGLWRFYYIYLFPIHTEITQNKNIFFQHAIKEKTKEDKKNNFQMFKSVAGFETYKSNLVVQNIEKHVKIQSKFGFLFLVKKNNIPPCN